MNNQKRFHLVLLTITVLALLCSCGITQSKPENLAQRFLEGEAEPDDFAPDGTYESTFGFDMIWFNQMGPGREHELEIHDVIVRDSMRPNSKEVTIWYTQRYNELDPPNNNWDAPLEEWILTGERIEDDGTAFFVLELLEGRWVVWCAETGGSSPRFPDLCEY